MSFDRSLFSRPIFWVHLFLWLAGIAVLNVPQFGLSVGVFSQTANNLLWPSIYGTLINAVLFYGHALWLLPNYLKPKKIKLYILLLAAGVLVLSIVETVLDVIYLLMQQGEISGDVVFETAYSNLLVHVIFFLIPSYIYGFLREWLKADTEITNGKQDQKEPTNSESENEYISIKSGTLIHRVPLKDICFIESDANYVIYHLTEKKITARDSLKNVEEQLSSKRFVRCHKSFIVGKKYVKTMDTDTIYIGKEKIPIGRTYKDQVRELVDGSLLSQ